MYSISWNGTSLETYGVLVRSHSLTLSRTYQSMQCQDRSWAGKGQGAPCVMTIDVYIVGVSKDQCEERYWDVRGLLDQEDECELKLDRFNDRYWMAKFDSLSPLTFVGHNTIQATLVFTCHDRKAYATSASSQTETLTENISADYGGIIHAICYDDDYVYVAGLTYNKVQQLSKVDLSLVAEGPDYGGGIWCLCCDTTNGYIYYGGDGGAGEYDMCKLLTSDMTTIVRGPDYGGIIHCCAKYGNYIYYGGNGGAGQYDMSKLLKSDMTTEVRGPDYGGIIYGCAVDSLGTYIYYGGDGGAGQYDIDKLDIATMAVEVRGPDYLAQIRGVAVDSTYVYGCGDTDKVQKLDVATMAVEVLSADLGSDLNAIAIDDDYVYVVGDDNVVYKLDIAFAAAASYVAKSEDYGGALWAIALDDANDWLYIGGATTQTVWKLDTRHMPELLTADNTNGQRDLCADDDYIYIAGGNSYRAYKIDKKTMKVMAISQEYAGGYIYAICEYGDYVYIGGQGGYIYKLLKDGLTLVTIIGPYKVLANPGDIYCLCTNGTNIYAGGDAVQYVASRFSCDGGGSQAESADQGDIIFAIDCDASNVYIGGATVQRVRSLHLTTLAFVAQSDDYGDTITNIHATDGLTLYTGGSVGTVWAVTKVGLVHALTSADFGTLGYHSLYIDDTYAYVLGTSRLYKLLLTDLSVIASVAFNGVGISVDDGNIYCTESDSVSWTAVSKLDKRVLWHRSDHEITITSAGTASCGLDFASTASQDNYWMQQYGNQTTGDEFDWEGTQASGEELEVDSELWYCTLEGASAMSGVSGEFLTLSPGANVLYIENVTGVVKFDWTDRSA